MHKERWRQSLSIQEELKICSKCLEEDHEVDACSGDRKGKGIMQDLNVDRVIHLSEKRYGREQMNKVKRLAASAQ